MINIRLHTSCFVFEKNTNRWFKFADHVCLDGRKEVCNQPFIQQRIDNVGEKEKAKPVLQLATQPEPVLQPEQKCPTTQPEDEQKISLVKRKSQIENSPGSPGPGTCEPLSESILINLKKVR